MIYSYGDWTFKAYIFQIFLELCLAGNTFNIFLHPIIFKRMQIKYHFYHRSSSNGMMMMIRSIWLINRYKHLRGNKKRQKILNRNSYYRPHNNLLSSQCLLLPSIFFPCHPPMLQYFFSPILGSVASIVCLLHHYCHACILLSRSLFTQKKVLS